MFKAHEPQAFSVDPEPSTERGVRTLKSGLKFTPRIFRPALRTAGTVDRSEGHHRKQATDHPVGKASPINQSAGLAPPLER
jgi:hypothetical protein